MPSKNECSFVGHIGRPLELKKGASGKSWGKMTVAVSTGKDAYKKTAWVSITLFGDKAEEASKWGKGDVAEFEKLVYGTETVENTETHEKKTFHGFTLPPWGTMTFSAKGAGHADVPRSSNPASKFAPANEEETNLPF